MKALQDLNPFFQLLYAFMHCLIVYLQHAEGILTPLRDYTKGIPTPLRDSDYLLMNESFVHRVVHHNTNQYATR